jgi:hypothetical protein
MKKKNFNDVYSPIIDDNTRMITGSLVINEDNKQEDLLMSIKEASAYVGGLKRKEVRYTKADFRKWESDVKKYGGYVDYEDFPGTSGRKIHVARPMGDDEGWFGRYTVSDDSNSTGGYLMIPESKNVTKNINESMIDPINVLIEEISKLKKMLLEQQEQIDELKNKPITESAKQNQPVGWKIIRDDKGNLERIIPEE